MEEPWETKTDDIRKVDFQRVFIIFCEDGAVEPSYFESFRRENVRISTHGNQKQHHFQVDNVTEFFRKNGLLEVDDHGHEVLKINDGAQVWCVFDRDREPNDGKDTPFNDSIRTANAKGIKTAWSNDDFELWVLLHFEDVDPTNSDYSHRTKYYERLTQILKERLPNQTSFQNPMFDYYTSMKSKKNFLTHTYQLMEGSVEVAIERAERLEAFHLANPPKPPHLHCPCTKVHLLVKELRS
jgi:RloB-like protein